MKGEFGTGIGKFCVFAEFFGEKSFVGSHDKSDHKKLVVFGAALEKGGLISAKVFSKLFSVDGFGAQALYEGNMNEPFINAVSAGEYPVFEGVARKGKGWMAKIKTMAYPERLKAEKKDRWQEFWE